MGEADKQLERGQQIQELAVHKTELEVQNEQLRDARNALEQSQSNYADLYDFAPVAYCSFDRRGAIVELNLTAAALLGKERRSLLGLPFSRFLIPGDRPRFIEHLRVCFETRQTARTELTLQSETGTPIVVQLASSPVVDAQNHVTLCHAALADITERKQAEENLRMSVRMREDFLAIVSHDLRNPLNSIMLSAESLLRSIPEGDRRHLGRKQLLIIKHATQRMNALVADLLDLSSMDAGHLSMQPAVHRVKDLLLAMEDIAEPVAAKKNVQLKTYVENPDDSAFCDRERVVQVLLNLVGNAIKFTPAGGLVCVEAKTGRAGVVIEVRDTGVGIEKGQLTHIFEPYWQAEKSAKKGTGLGLSIAKGIVRLHGGKIWVESEPGRGSRFFFTLPSAPPVGKSTTDGKHILVVDDDEDSRQLLAEALSEDGYEVSTAADGAEALRELRSSKQKPFLVLLDLVMPVMDGWQFLAARKGEPDLEDIPVVLISGQANAHEALSSYGLAGRIEKPITIANLRQVVNRAAERRD
jgi:PAS domain S-box-containing protein